MPSSLAYSSPLFLLSSIHRSPTHRARLLCRYIVILIILPLFVCVSVFVVDLFFFFFQSLIIASLERSLMDGPRRDRDSGGFGLRRRTETLLPIPARSPAGRSANAARDRRDFLLPLCLLLSPAPKNSDTRRNIVIGPGPRLVLAARLSNPQHLIQARRATG